ncbi:unnamed protein product [Caenorhabditis sp. 36 PRJEB53466]|nr:unnamed protein product [Caenorhabditis sp. 36 PRJEB53466]
MSSHAIFVVCAKKNKAQSSFTQPTNPTAGTPTSNVPNGAMPPASPAAASQTTSKVERDDRDSTRTKAGNKNKVRSKESDSTDDAFANLAARLAKKEKAEKTADSLVGDDDQNPLAQFDMPERPVVEPNVAGAKFQNIVELEKKEKAPPDQHAAHNVKNRKDRTPLGKTAKENSVADGRSTNGQGESRIDEAITTDKTQSEPRGKSAPKDVEKTQVGTLDDDLNQTQLLSVRANNASFSTKNRKKEKS